MSSPAARKAMAPRGSRQYAVLAFLLEEGTATTEQIGAVAGCETKSLAYAVIADMRQKTWLQRVDRPHRMPATYGLTRLGIERALELAQQPSPLGDAELSTTAVIVAPAPQAEPAPTPNSAPAPSAEAGADVSPGGSLPPSALGWSFERDLMEQVVDAPTSLNADGALDQAIDLVCAINSLGELALDRGGDAKVVKLSAGEALVLKRFLDNTSVLEELAGREAA